MADGTRTPHKKVFIKTYGCQMNVYDSDRMADVLKPEGYAQTDVEAEADLIVLNTCHIREKATEKVYSELGRIRSKAKKRGTTPMVAVAGCVAQAEGAEIARRAKNVDLVIGPQSYQDLPGLLHAAAVRRSSGEALNLEALDFDVTAKFKALKGARKSTGPSAMVSVQEGCDKFCTFCVVPYTRGSEVSRDVDAVVAEVRDLVHQGVRDITLLGQNVNAYHGAGPDGRTWSLAHMLRHLAKIDGLERLRYMTSHPRDMDDDLIAAHGDLEKLMPYLHLPIQSGSDRVLDAMNRRHTAEDYLRLIDRLKQARPDLALSSDFIVGFPGETDAEFEDTMALVRAVTYASAFSFKYSPRPGTPAADDAAQIPEEVKDQRLYALQELLGVQTDAFNAAQIGQVMPILMDKPGKFDGQIQGRSPYLQSVYIDVVSSDIMGQIVPVRILSASRSSLKGERV